MNASPTVAETLDFLRDYHAGKHPGQRLGQAFVNRFRVDDNEGRLFNATCPVRARALIWEASRIEWHA